MQLTLAIPDPPDPKPPAPQLAPIPWERIDAEARRAALDLLARVAEGETLEDCRTLVKLMEQASGEKARMWGTSIVGFGLTRLVYASGREADWPLIGFSPRETAGAASGGPTGNERMSNSSSAKCTVTPVTFTP